MFRCLLFRLFDVITIIASIILIYYPSIAVAAVEQNHRVGVWNGFNEQINIVECVNGSPNEKAFTLSIFDADGSSIGVINETLAPHGTKHAILNSFSIANRYGTFMVESDEATPASISCVTVFYRMASDPEAKVLQYAFSLPMIDSQQGERSGIFNSISPDGGILPVYNWLTLLNTSSQPFSGRIQLYDDSGTNLNPPIQISDLPPGARMDFPLGHPDGQRTGLYRIVPSDFNQDYGFYLARYGSNAIGDSNFAFALLPTLPDCFPKPVTASTFGSAFNWGEIANPSGESLPVTVEILNQLGQRLLSESVSVPPHGQIHIPLHQYLGPDNLGTMRVSCANWQNQTQGVLATSLFYGHISSDPTAVAWAYASQALPSDSSDDPKMLIAPANTFLGARNWLKTVNRSGSSLSANTDIFTGDGISFAGERRPVPARGTIDLAIHETLTENQIGHTETTADFNQEALSIESIRVFPHKSGEIGYILNMPVAKIPVFDHGSSSSSSSSAGGASSGEFATLVEEAELWKYFKGDQDAPSGWNLRTFDDREWLGGISGIGYGDDDDRTVLDDMRNRYITVYTRKLFGIAFPDAFDALTLEIDYDDGFIAYLNGTEVARRGLGPSGSPIDRNTLATSHEAGTRERIAIPRDLLVAGSNVLSIEIHNNDITSSDLTLIPRLVARFAGSGSSSSSSAGSGSSASSSSASSSSSNSSSSSSSSSDGSNLPPTADSKSVTVTQNNPTLIVLTGRDPEGRTLTFSLIDRPRHGTLSGTAPNILYTPAVNYLGNDSFTYISHDGSQPSALATVNITVSTFRAQIGVPNPPLISATHFMYVGQRFDFNQNGVLEPGEEYRDYGNGPATHIVDNTHPGTIHGPANPSWPYGSADHPLREIPPNPPAGSVIEIRGTGYNYGGGEILIYPRNGTAERPIFYRGINFPRIDTAVTLCSPNEHPTPSHRTGCDYIYRSQYAIFEGLDVKSFKLMAANDHIVFRNSNVFGGSATAFGGIWETVDGTFYDNPSHNIVFFQNYIHDNGDFAAGESGEIHGTKVFQNVHDFWILNSEYARNSGDGIQVGNNAYDSTIRIDHGYIAGNLLYGNRQTGVAGKGSSNIILSQNTVHSHVPVGPSPSAWGSGLGFQYGAENWWFLYNHIYNCTNGITTGSASGGIGRNIFIVGNVIHDIEDAPDFPSETESGWGWAAISLHSTANRYIVNNTIYNVVAGINLLGGINLTMQNNIVANVTNPLSEHFFEDDSSNLVTRILENNIFYQNGSSARFRWDNHNYALPNFQSSVGVCGNCRELNPQFVDTTGRDLHVRSDSPARDTGISDYTGSVYELFDQLYPTAGGIRVDFDRNPRQGALDIGAYEYQP